MNLRLFYRFLLILALGWGGALFAQVRLGVDLFFEEGQYHALLKNKRVGLIANQTSVNRHLVSTYDLLHQHAKDYQFVAVFAPEHGFHGIEHAGKDVAHSITKDGVPVHSLHGKTRRPTAAMLKQVDLIIFDIQDIGSRSYTYLSTLCYVMEAAAKQNVAVVVLDRPNPIGGTVVDGPLVDKELHSFLGYLNIPYCHGMTVGEIAQLFNNEYKIGCQLTVVPMKGWKRSMTLYDTGLHWVPSSPNVPEADTPFYYPTTGILGELEIVNIGIGYTLPFKLVGAPWIDGKKLADELNAQHFPGVHFHPYHFRPFFGRYKGEACQGIQIVITDPAKFLPVTTQYLIIGMLKSLYPARFAKAIQAIKRHKTLLCELNGREEVVNIISQDSFIAWKLKAICDRDRKLFAPIRAKYLNPNY